MQVGTGKGTEARRKTIRRQHGILKGLVTMGYRGVVPDADSGDVRHRVNPSGELLLKTSRHGVKLRLDELDELLATLMEAREEMKRRA